MASKGPRSKLDHDTRARRQKALEVPKEPPRPKAHWDHVLEEMVWLSKDFESERKWKLAQAKKVAVRASKSMVDHATRGEKKVKEEEQRLKKIALNISKDVKKFWMKIEKLVLYKHQLELEERKKKTLDKQLDFLLGQTERYSTMLAENLGDMPYSQKTMRSNASGEINGRCHLGSTEQPEHLSGNMESDGDYGVQSEDESEDDEQTIEEDEAFITEEEKKEELAGLQHEMDLPIEELLKRYANNEVSREGSPENSKDVTKPSQSPKAEVKGNKVLSESSVLQREQAKLSEDDLATSVSSGEHSDSVEQANDSLTPMLVENLSEADSVPASEENLPVGQKIERNRVSADSKHDGKSNGATSLKDRILLVKRFQSKPSPKGHITSDDEYMLLDSADELDDEKTLSEEEELAKEEEIDPIDEHRTLKHKGKPEES